MTKSRVVACALALSFALVAGAPLTASPAPQDKVRVAVMNFENNSSWHYWGDNLGQAAADELVTQLFKTGKFALVERDQIRRFADLQRAQVGLEAEEARSSGSPGWLHGTVAGPIPISPSCPAGSPQGPAAASGA